MRAEKVDVSNLLLQLKTKAHSMSSRKLKLNQIDRFNLARQCFDG